MVTIKLTRAEWDTVVYILGQHNDNGFVLSVWNQIQDQIDSLEY